MRRKTRRGPALTKSRVACVPPAVSAQTRESFYYHVAVEARDSNVAPANLRDSRLGDGISSLPYDLMDCSHWLFNLYSLVYWPGLQIDL